MTQKALARWLKGIIILVGLCGLVVYFVLLGMFGAGIARQNPEFAYCFWPWLIFLWSTAIPCYCALGFCWRVAWIIGWDRSFSMDNARCLRWVSRLALGDTIWFFGGNLVLLCLNMNHPGVVLLSLIVVAFGIAVTVAAAALSHLVAKAAAMKDENDLTI